MRYVGTFYFKGPIERVSSGALTFASDCDSVLMKFLSHGTGYRFKLSDVIDLFGCFRTNFSFNHRYSFGNDFIENRLDFRPSLSAV